jgi:hypothetical protein
VKFKTLQLDESGSSLLLVRGPKSKSRSAGRRRHDWRARRSRAFRRSETGIRRLRPSRCPKRNTTISPASIPKERSPFISRARRPTSPARSPRIINPRRALEDAEGAGIIGAVSIANPKHMDIPWSRQASNRGQATMTLAAPGNNDNEGEQITIAWNPAHADELFAGTGHTFDELLALAEVASRCRTSIFRLPSKRKPP